MVVCLPSATLYSEPQLFSEQTDEMLYGDEVEILEEQGGFCRVRTDYGYEGWCVRQAVFELLHKPEYYITVPFADLLFEGKNYYHAPISLPMGARLDYGPGHDGRYGLAVLPSKRIYFIHRNHVAPLSAVKTLTRAELRESVARVALSYLGVQYRWGGRTHAGVDCSGLCFNACRFNGVDIWRDADVEKTKNLKKIPLEEAQKGDLLFFEGHMALYLGEGKFVHASASAGKVIVSEVAQCGELFNRFITAGDVIR
ncbi:MAG: C40 family peptidase [Clostridia bacterium]|nr:C40 family peptidase [Clostridia bacterium]